MKIILTSLFYLVHLQVLRVLPFNKLTKVNKEICVNLKFLWFRSKNSTYCISERLQTNWSWKSKVCLMCWTDKRRTSQKRDRHGSALLETLLCSAWKYFHLLCWSTQTSDRVLFVFYLGCCLTSFQQLCSCHHCLRFAMGQVGLVGSGGALASKGTLFWGNSSDRAPSFRDCCE